MAFPSLVTPPNDAAGGILVLEYNVGARVHTVRFHVQQFTLSSLTTASDGNPDYSYADSESFLGITFSTTELTLHDTVSNLCGVLKPYYPSTTAFAVRSLYQCVSGVVNEVFPAVQVNPILGTGAPGGTPAIPAIVNDYDDENFIATRFTMRTRGGARTRTSLVGAAARELQNRAKVYPTSGGLNIPSGTDVLDQAVCAYLTDSRTRLVGRDGQQLAGPVTVHTSPLARYRRNNSLA